MRPGQHQNNKRMRGRNRGKGPNPLNRSYESNGPDVKIRGSAQHIAEKYLQLARDAQASGDRVMGENYMQHAEHYFRLLAAAQAQFAPHLPAYVRPDEALEDDEEFDETDVAAQPGDAQALQAPQVGPQGGYPPQGPGQGQGQGREFRPRWERGDRQDRQDRYERGERGDRYERRERPDRFQGGERGPAPERAEFGEQPSVEFPQRREQGYEPRPPRAERPERPERGPRPERAPRPEREREDVVAAEAGNGEAVLPEAPAVETEEGREPGLPSFLTRGRRRGRPPYRRRDEDEAAENGAAPADEANEAATPTPPAANG